ncbi:LHFPL tetraspan subfamily member 7 protein [Parasteatoda tepidariorum]|uniref:LHFPL tetraspan subfamily member 7 protein n=1 Tax=Parasteatoda tepidariorum TaxID=114398 RepID=UPI001C71E95F|nr:LHFPL tetraspan subfamily member 2 protein-like [Parasteatoda tepidariorum]XP_042896657.1 LHFPL tetraspan subfamily member 2 protein-like [Parasteatoda tepidariorum]
MQVKVCRHQCKHNSNTKPQFFGSHTSPCTVVHVELVTSWPVTILWILLSWLVSTLATAAYVHPEWFVRETQGKTDILKYDRDELVTTLGMVSVCHRGQLKGSLEELQCRNFDEDFPSSSWQTSYVLFGSGCVLLTWCSILAFCNVWIVGKKNRQLVAMLIGRIQLVAVILQAASLLMYPLILGSSFAKIHCGPLSEIYYPAGCRIGWAYIAAITSTVLACYCPLLAHFSHYNIFSPCLWTEI